MIAGPAFVTPHAVSRFRQRIRPLGYEQALGVVIRGLDHGVRSVTPVVPLDDGRARCHVRCAIDVDGMQVRFVATVVFDGQREPQVVTIRSWMRGTSRGCGKGRRPDREKFARPSLSSPPLPFSGAREAPLAGDLPSGGTWITRNSDAREPGGVARSSAASRPYRVGAAITQR